MSKAKVQFELAPPEFDTQGLAEVAISVLPPLLLLGGLFFLVRHPSPSQPHPAPPLLLVRWWRPSPTSNPAPPPNPVP